MIQSFVHSIFVAVGGFVVATMSKLGYGGIVVLMGIESANIPLPSEIIMPFSGYLVFKGQFTLFWCGFYGALGCLVGSILSYFLGKFGGRPFILKYGKYVLISKRDLRLADEWFGKYGEFTIFFTRLLPIVRTFISFPAGITRMNFPRFCLYTFVGSFPWCLALAWVGVKLGEHWDRGLGAAWKKFEVLIAVVIIALAVWYIRRHFLHLKEDGEDELANGASRKDEKAPPPKAAVPDEA